MNPLETLKHHVTGAIERGEKEAIVEKKPTTYPGIDYARGTTTNRNPATGIHYGVISQHDVGEAWFESSEAFYGSAQAGNDVECSECGEEFTLECSHAWGASVECPHCAESFDLELPDFAEPISHYVDNQEISAECGESGDIFITNSLYYTHAQFCSPCAPGAGHLANPCADGPRTYCFGHDWFQGGVAPYPVYSVATGELVTPNA